MKDKIIQYVIKSNATLEEVIEVNNYLDTLERDSKKLWALEAAGVDNWQGYDFAITEFYEEEEE